MEGLIILGLVLLFLIILYIIAELWKKDSSDEDDEAEYEDSYDESEDAYGQEKSKRQLKKEAKEQKRRQKEEEQAAYEEARSSKKRKKGEKRKVHTGGFVDDIDEDDDDEDEPLRDDPSVMGPAETEAHRHLKNEVAAATNNIAAMTPEAMEEVKLDLPDEPEPEPEAEISDVDEEPEIAEIRRRAIPGWNSSQLAKEAEKAGEKPDIMKDDITDVTLFDYSDILDED